MKIAVAGHRGYHLQVSCFSRVHPLRALPPGDDINSNNKNNNNNNDDEEDKNTTISNNNNNNSKNTTSSNSLSEEIQERLISSLQFEIGATRNLDEHVKESGEKLKALAEEAKDEMDKAAELAKLRGDLAFDSALADINREADKFERKLRQRREAMEQEREEMQAWVRDVGDSRNQGQFFGNLYGEYLDEEEEEEEEGRKNISAMDPYERMEVMERRKRVMEPAEKEIRSPARMYIFMVLGGMLVVNVVSDVVGQGPSSWGLDGLYLVLALIAFWIVVSERKELDEMNH